MTGGRCNMRREKKDGREKDERWEEKGNERWKGER